VDTAAGFTHARVDARVQRLEHMLFDHAQREPGLIRDHDDLEVGTGERANRVQRAGNEDETVEGVEIADVFVDGAVAVEKDGWLHNRSSARAYTVSAVMRFMQR